MIFKDKDGQFLKEGDHIQFERGEPELLYACDIDGSEGLGVNASRHYPGRELYPLTEFPCEMTADGKIRMLTGIKI